MSGVEAVAVVGLVSNALQFVEFTGKLCSRIREYSYTAVLPEKLASQANRLWSILTALKSLEETSATGLDTTILQQCQSLAEKLSGQLDCLKSDGQKSLHNYKKAFRSLRGDKELQEMQLVLDQLVNVLALQLQIDSRSISQAVERNTEAIVKFQVDHSAQLANLSRFTNMTLYDNHRNTTTTEPIWMVPIGRNPDFVGREVILEELDARLKSRPDTVRSAVLYGLGGVGKFQIALEYAYRVRDQAKDISIFWVHAATTAQFIESYSRIASECKVPGRDQHDRDVCQLVRAWLETRCECQFLMIIDNVDDRAMFFDHPNQYNRTLQQYIPQNPQGSIVYTTRNRDIGVDLLHGHEPINTPSVETHEAKAMLGEAITTGSSEDELYELLHELVFLPLAISQAAAFMIKRKRRVSQYLDMYRASEPVRVKLLGQRSNYHGRETRLLESVLTTWWISFDQIKSENCLAYHILSVMSFMDRQRIPRELVVFEGIDTFNFEEAIGLLEAFSLITPDESGMVYNVHSLVCIAIQSWLKEYDPKSDYFAFLAVKRADSIFSLDNTREARLACAACLPHAQAVVRNTLASYDKKMLFSKLALLRNLSVYLWDQHSARNAMAQAEEAVRLAEVTYGAENPQCLYSVGHLAQCWINAGKYTKAAELVQEWLTYASGEEACVYFKLMGTLGQALSCQGKYKEAGGLICHALSGVLHLFEDNFDAHSIKESFLSLQKMLFENLRRQGNWTQFFKTYHSLIKSAWSPDWHYEVSLDIAWPFFQFEEEEEAESLFRKVLDHQIEALGIENPETLTTMGHLAHIACEHGKYEEAEKDFSFVYETTRSFLSDDDPLSLGALDGLTSCICSQGRYHEAETLARSILGATEASFGPLSSKRRRLVAKVLDRCNRVEEAYQMYHSSLNIADNLEDDPLRLEVLFGLANHLEKQSKWEEAESLRRQQFNISMHMLGQNESEFQDGGPPKPAGLVPQTREVIRNETTQMLEQVNNISFPSVDREFERAILTLRRAAEECNTQGTSHIRQDRYHELENVAWQLPYDANKISLFCLSKLAYTQQRQGKSAQCEANYRLLWAMSAKTLGPEDIWTLGAISDLAYEIRHKDNVSEEAAALLRDLVTIEKRLFGTEDKDTQWDLRQLVDHLNRMGDLEEAETYRAQIVESEETNKHSKEDLDDSKTEDQQHASSNS